LKLSTLITKNQLALAAAAMMILLRPVHAVMISDESGNAAPATATPTPKSGNGSPYAQGERVAYASLALGGIGGGYGSTSVPPFIVGMDWGVDKNISAGGFVGFARTTYNYGYIGSDYDWSYTYIPIAARACYHVLDVVKDMPLDPYVAVALGYNIVTVSGKYTDNASTSYLLFGADIGARYWFKPNLAGQLEFGYGLGFVSLGIAYKL
jgi:hypothetical protein